MKMNEFWIVGMVLLANALVIVFLARGMLEDKHEKAPLDELKVMCLDGVRLACEEIIQLLEESPK